MSNPLFIFGNDVGGFDSSVRFQLDNNFSIVSTFSKAAGVVADGVIVSGSGTDNYAIIQSQINSLGAGGCLLLPAGIIRVSQSLKLPSPFMLMGQGNWITILMVNSSFNDPTGVVNCNGVGGPPTSVKDLAIIAQNGGAGPVSAGYVASANATFASNLWISGFSTNAILAASDGWLTDSCIEQAISGGTGISVTSPDVTIANCETYACYIGMAVTNPYLDGTVTISNVRSLACGFSGFTLSGNNIALDNCSVGHNNTGAYTSTGINISSGADISISNFIAKLGGGPSTSGIGIAIGTPLRVTITGSKISGFLDGINAAGGASEISIVGNNCSANGRRGIYVGGSDRVNISGNTCIMNGTSVGTTDAGIYLDNTSAFAVYNVNGNLCTQNGGGNQDYGIYANIGSASAFTNLVGNMNRYNNIAQIATAGTVANIQQVGNY